jgi:hypothetical protein
MPKVSPTRIRKRKEEPLAVIRGVVQSGSVAGLRLDLGPGRERSEVLARFEQHIAWENARPTVAGATPVPDAPFLLILRSDGSVELQVPKSAGSSVSGRMLEFHRTVMSRLSGGLESLL